MLLKPDEGKKRQNWMRYAGLGGTFLSAILLSLLAGRWADGKTGSDIPWFTLMLPVAAIAGILVQLNKEMKK